MLPALRSAGSACLVMMLAAGPARGAQLSASSEADSLHRQALALLANNRVEERRVAMRFLERAALLAPNHLDHQLALAQVYYRMGFLKQARQRFERAGQLAPGNAAAQLGLGEVWRRDYLKYLDKASLGRAVTHFHGAADLAPADAEPWLKLAPLQLEQNDLTGAFLSAERSLAADPERAEALLAVAHLSFRLGRVERADSAFRLAIPRLPALARARFDDIAPVASEADTARLRRLSAPEQVEFRRRFWRENDPDPVTPENEAQLEYWSRVSQAYFLYFNPRRREWDERGEYYVRYGPPESAIYNPVGSRLSFSFQTGPGYPMNALVWSYPGLGMTVTMEDRLLSEFYLPPITRDPPVGREPNPAVLAARDDVLPTRGGRGVFPLLPPGARRLPVDGVLARFEAGSGPQLLAFLEAAGEPGDTLWAEWVVLDTARHELARGRRDLAPSPCDPVARRAAEFASVLPPGDYIAGLSVRDPRGGRGVFRAPIRIEPPPRTLSLSDVLVACGAPQVEGPGPEPSVRLQANPGARVAGADPLTVYFETYHLRPGGDGRSRFELEYTVHSAARDRRVWIQRLLAPRPEIPAISAIRREEQAGTLRRQYVSIPIQGLPLGRYRLEIRVRDLVAAVEALRTVEFEKVDATGS
ncbi:MAG TPA: GWxTD domain-containing protein [Candidatus Limnocylindria bacterium]|nr:GWxTD domain-containing protein [Candidatus Limnocylindria bacterium]